jgi:predicted lipoprotein with Yx(FWY)xxD motif
MQDNHRTRPIRIARRAAVATSVAAIALVLASLALASTPTVTVGSLSNAKLGEKIVVNSQDRTLYTLSGETASHLLCKSSLCLKFWPPLTAPSRSAKLELGAGIHGKLGILRRSNGTLQVTLRGVPLYRFFKDTARGQVNGQGIKSFGGTWHAATASGNVPTSTPMAPSPTPAPTPTSEPPANPPYGY